MMMEIVICEMENSYIIYIYILYKCHFAVFHTMY
jgi:hypothetical protein